MQHNTSRAFVYFCLPCLALCLALVALANDARNFAGFYTITQVAKQGEKVEMRLSLHVFNYTGADVKNATISLKSSLPHPDDPHDREALWEKAQPTFRGVTLHLDERKVVAPLEGTFTVPAREYEQWMKGARPNFVIEFQDAAGKKQRQSVELTQIP